MSEEQNHAGLHGLKPINFYMLTDKEKKQFRENMIELLDKFDEEDNMDTKSATQAS